MRGFVPTNGWMVKTATLCVKLALQQRQLLHFFIGNKGRPSPLKVACVIMIVRAQSSITVA